MKREKESESSPLSLVSINGDDGQDAVRGDGAAVAAAERRGDAAAVHNGAAAVAAEDVYICNNTDNKRNQCRMDQHSRSDRDQDQSEQRLAPRFALYTKGARYLQSGK